MRTFSLRYFIYLVLIASSACGLSLYSHQPQSHWVVLSAFLIVLLPLDKSIIVRCGIIVLTGTLAALLAGIASICASSSILLQAFFFFLTFFCVYLAQTYRVYSFHFFVINMIAILGGSFPASQQNVLARSIAILLGAFIVMIFQLIFAYRLRAHEKQAWFKLTLQHLARLNTALFATLQQANYPENIYMHERIIHTQKKQFLASLNQLRHRNTNDTSGTDFQNQTLSVLDQLFNIIIDCGLIRRRVSDHTIFLLCAAELQALKEEINKCILEMIRKHTQGVNTDTLDKKISNFQDIYFHVMHVTAREPLVFILFIDSLNQFSQTMKVQHDQLPRR